MNSNHFFHKSVLGSLIKWIFFGGVVGLLTGSASAIFLISLAYVTDVRLANPWLLFLLPLGGALVSYLYHTYGLNSSKGNNLIFEQVQEREHEHVPLRMAPLVLFGTLITHLLGGSAGREGTAVQMGGSLADQFGRWIKVGPIDRKIILMCGISGGFGSIFGTPIAGAVFALEVIVLGMMRYDALIPCFIASFTGNIVAMKLWGITHTQFDMGSVPTLTFMVLLKVILASIYFGLTSRLFSQLTHFLKKTFAKFIHNPMLKTAVGGLVIIIMVYVVGSRDYLGLGVNLISDSFEGDVHPFAFFGKLLFTSVTLGAGFQGGEVTPLFAMGATLGHSLAGVLHMYAPFLAALGFIAVFSGATNTPIACFLMGIELFGSEGAVFMFIACVVSYLFSGPTGIYTSQQIGVPKNQQSP
ncbi:voltage-gated chloride channel family protein [Paenibacillus sp. CMAA1364]